MNWFWPTSTNDDVSDPSRETRTKTWDISASHTKTERARILAEVALFAIRCPESFIDASAFKIAEVLEKYEIVDNDADAGRRSLEGQ